LVVLVCLTSLGAIKAAFLLLNVRAGNNKTTALQDRELEKIRKAGV
jgi:hypothetical protein